MTLSEANSIAVRCLYYANYGGKHAHFADDVQHFMQRYPRGKGIKGHETELLRLYEACRIVNAERSRTTAYRPDGRQGEC